VAERIYVHENPITARRRLLGSGEKAIGKKD